MRPSALAVGLAVPVLVAVGADLLAAPLPLAVRVDGSSYVLPCLFEPAALRGETQQTLEARADWQLGTPVPFGPLQTGASSFEQHLGPPPWGPDARHWLGTDELGRDVLARLIHGARVSLLVALGTVLLSLLVGLWLGALAGFLGGAADVVVSRAIEVMSTFPTLFFLLALFSVLRDASVVALVLVLGLTRWADIARVTRAEVQRLTTLDFTRAAVASGASRWFVLRRHLLPNALGPVLVAATFSVAGTLMLESALTFLGLGVAAPTASWGELLLEAHRNLLHPGAWWLALFPGLALAYTVLVVNACGEAMRRAVDGRP